jgi:hypothetical protein
VNTAQVSTKTLKFSVETFFHCLNVVSSRLTRKYKTILKKKTL